ncbi:MAG: hypothetical protein V2B13_09415 [Pseudomonadota bacterium]
MGNTDLRDQFNQIEKKLDTLLSFFAIGSKPQRNILEFSQWADKAAEKIRDKDFSRRSKN